MALTELDFPCCFLEAKQELPIKKDRSERLLMSSMCAAASSVPASPFLIYRGQRSTDLTDE